MLSIEQQRPETRMSRAFYGVRSMSGCTRYRGKNVILTPLISSFCRTSGEVTAESGTVSLPPDKLIDLLYCTSFSGPSTCAMFAAWRLWGLTSTFWRMVDPGKVSLSVVPPCQAAPADARLCLQHFVPVFVELLATCSNHLSQPKEHAAQLPKKMRQVPREPILSRLHPSSFRSLNQPGP